MYFCRHGSWWGGPDSLGLRSFKGAGDLLGEWEPGQPGGRGWPSVPLGDTVGGGQERGQSPCYPPCDTWKELPEQDREPKTSFSVSK